ncbi:NUDIX domain-containing protein [Kitasatospora sp. NPDC101157]|uniref:NUDIX domain-containing protein n=1 Tax=Kitasatospora sp. NPDC101157 TaxID=3364098 RepID=UPI0037F12974
MHYASDRSSTLPAWTIPGGKVEEGERLDEAATRELREETGLVVAPEELRLVRTIQDKAGWDSKGPILLSVFAATSWQGELTNTGPDKHLAHDHVPVALKSPPADPPPARRPQEGDPRDSVHSRYRTGPSRARSTLGRVRHTFFESCSCEPRVPR